MSNINMSRYLLAATTVVTLLAPVAGHAGDAECQNAAQTLHGEHAELGFDNVEDCSGLASILSERWAAARILGVRTSVETVARPVESPIATVGTGAANEAIPTALPVSYAGFGAAPVLGADGGDFPSRWALYASVNPGTVFGPETRPAGALDAAMRRIDLSTVAIFDVDGESAPYFGARLRYNVLSKQPDCDAPETETAFCRLRAAVAATLPTETVAFVRLTEVLGTLTESSVEECASALLDLASHPDMPESATQAAEAACGEGIAADTFAISARNSALIADAIAAYRLERTRSFFGFDLRIDVGDPAVVSTPESVDTDYGLFGGAAGGHRWSIGGGSHGTLGLRGALGVSHASYLRSTTVAPADPTAEPAETTSAYGQTRMHGTLGAELLTRVGQDFAATTIGFSYERQMTEGEATCLNGTERDNCVSLVGSLSVPLAEGHRISIVGSRLLADAVEPSTNWTLTYNSQALWRRSRPRAGSGAPSAPEPSVSDGSEGVDTGEEE